MRTTSWIVLALVSGTLAAVPDAMAGNCNNTNYGVQVNTYIIARCDGDTFTYIQYCNQTTGAGGGAGSGVFSAGSPGADPSSGAAVEGTAGTNCNQASGGNSTETDLPGEFEQVLHW